MLPTPETQHMENLPVYPPSEDSFLLLDTLEAQSEYLRLRFATDQALVVTEVGTGSGVVIAFLAAHSRTIFGHGNTALMALDMNPYACLATGMTVTRAVKEHKASSGHYLNGMMSDLTGAVRPGSIDVLVFNPPYVPSDELPEPVTLEHIPSSTTADFETESRFLAIAVSGGPDGMVSTWKLLDQLGDVLSTRGVAYVLLCSRNKPARVMQRLVDSDWKVEKVGSSGKKGGIEKLCILRISR